MEVNQNDLECVTSKPASAAARYNNINFTTNQIMTTATLEPETSGRKPQDFKLARRQSRKAGLFDPQLMKTAFWQSLVMLRPDIQWKNPVMFVVEVGTVMTLVYTVANICGLPAASLGYLLSLDFWLVATLLFANFASSIAEARGKAQADALEDAPEHARSPPQG